MKIYTINDLTQLAKILDLTDAEHRVLASTASGYPKFVSKIAQEAVVPRSSVQNILSIFKRRGLAESLSTITPYWGKRDGNPKRVLWRSDIRKIARRMQNVAHDILSK